MILDDQSTEGTADILIELSNRYPWIQYVRYDGVRAKRLGLHLAKIKAYVTESAFHIMKAQQRTFDYIGILDADIRIPPSFYDKMIEEMEKNHRLGLISAKILETDGKGRLQFKQSRDDLPGCATILCRLACFEEIGGIDPNLYPEDAVMVAKAKLRSWQTARSATVTATQLRKTSSGQGKRMGYEYEGEKIYFLRHNPLYVAFRSIHIAMTSGLPWSFFFLAGYFKGFLRGDSRLQDLDLTRYFRRDRFREILQDRFIRNLPRNFHQISHQ